MGSVAYTQIEKVTVTTIKASQPHLPFLSPPYLVHHIPIPYYKTYSIIPYYKTYSIIPCCKTYSFVPSGESNSAAGWMVLASQDGR